MYNILRHSYIKDKFSSFSFFSSTYQYIVIIQFFSLFVTTNGFHFRSRDTLPLPLRTILFSLMFYCCCVYCFNCFLGSQHSIHSIYNGFLEYSNNQECKCHPIVHKVSIFFRYYHVIYKERDFHWRFYLLTLTGSDFLA